MAMSDVEENLPVQSALKNKSNEYMNARKMGERAYRKAVANGQYPYLPALEFFFPDGNSDVGVPIGVKEIALSQVVGTKTRMR